MQNQASAFRATYRYNGLGHRITWHDDADNDTDVDANDPVYHLAVTEGGSMLAVYRGSDANVKEQIYLHLYGLNGWPSVKCDGETEVIVVDADRSTAWSSAADATAETRSYMLTNQRSDVVTLVSEAGRVRERPRYSAYGVPMLIMRTDWDADGDVDSSTGAGTDQAAYEADYFAGSPPARADYNLDGSIDPDDLSDYIADRTADAGGGYGYGRLSSAGVGNRKGFSGWEHGRTMADLGHYNTTRLVLALGTAVRSTASTRPNGPVAPQMSCEEECSRYFPDEFLPADGPTFIPRGPGHVVPPSTTPRPGCYPGLFGGDHPCIIGCLARREADDCAVRCETACALTGSSTCLSMCILACASPGPLSNRTGPCGDGTWGRPMGERTCVNTQQQKSGVVTRAPRRPMQAWERCAGPCSFEVCVTTEMRSICQQSWLCANGMLHDQTWEQLISSASWCETAQGEWRPFGGRRGLGEAEDLCQCCVVLGSIPGCVDSLGPINLPKPMEGPMQPWHEPGWSPPPPRPNPSPVRPVPGR